MKAQSRRLRSDSASNSIIAPAVVAIAILLSLIGIAIFAQSGSATTSSTLEISADVPPSLGPQTPGTVTVHFTNTGITDMPAPLLVLQASGNALLTLDQSKSGQALDTTSTPPGFSDTIQILASGQTAGVLMAGESASLPIYFCGLVKPRDTRQTSVDFTLSSFETDNATAIDWAGIKDSMRPDSISPEAWTPIWSNFTASMGGTWGSYVASLDQDAAYLGGLGEKIMDARDLIGFEIMQADGLGTIGSLASSTDASIAAPGLPIIFSRSFSGNISGRNQLGPLGRGWSHSWQISLSTANNGTVTVKGPGGSSRSYYPENGGYSKQPGDHATLAATGGGTFTLTETSGMKTAFTADGKLNYIEDTNGNRITAGYTGADLTSLSHSSGQSLTLAYAAGRVVSISDPTHGTTSYNYDSTGEHLTSVQDYTGKTTAYSYLEGGGAATEHALTAISFPGGNHNYLEYDGQGRLSHTGKDGNAEATDFSYGPGGEVATTDANGTTTRVFIDHHGLTVRTVDPLGNELNSSFDADYNLTGITDAAGKSYAYSYDAQGNMTSSTDPAGHTTQFGYGSLSRMTSLTDAKGNPTSYSYDTEGNKDSTTYANGATESWAYDSNGSPTAKTNGRGNTISYAYDSSGRVTSKGYADGSTISYSYDTAGHMISTNNSTGITNFTYDQDLLSHIDYPGGRYLQFTYDDAGRRASSLDQLGHRLDYHYNLVGRLESMTDETNHEIVRYEYDAAGRLTRKTVGNGGYTNYEYDAASHVLSLVNSKADGEMLSRFDYSYDSRGRRTSMATLDGDWSYEYDDLGQLTHAVFASINPVVSNQDLTYNYDAMGNRTSTVTNGATVSYTTNNMNQYTQTHVVQAANLPLTVSVNNVYWGSYSDYTARQLTVDVSVRNDSDSDVANIKITGADSSDGVSISSNLPASFGDVSSHSEGTGTLKYHVPTGVSSFRSNFRGVAEDACGVKHHYPGDTTPDTSYSYDADGNLITELSLTDETSYVFSDENQLLEVSAPGVNLTYSYDANGKRVSSRYNGSITKYVVDPIGLGNVVGEYGSSNELKAYYGYGLGLIERSDSVNGAVFYDFDAIGSTIAMTDGSGQVVNSYRYDPYGKILQKYEQHTNKFQFDGEDGVIAEQSGNCFLRNRSYQPEIGRFNSLDPQGVNGGDINLYIYAGNKPMLLKDPTGLSTLFNLPRMPVRSLSDRFTISWTSFIPIDVAGIAYDTAGYWYSGMIGDPLGAVGHAANQGIDAYEILFKPVKYGLKGVSIGWTALHPDRFLSPSNAGVQDEFDFMGMCPVPPPKPTTCPMPSSPSQTASYSILLGAITQISTGSVSNYCEPEINAAGEVVWPGPDRSGRMQIFLYSPSIGVRQISTGTFNGGPQINADGQVIWVGRDTSGNYQIYLHTPDGGVSQISTGSGNSSPQINANGQVVWQQGSSNVSQQIFLYVPGSGVSQISTSASYGSAQINSSGQVVWYGYEQSSSRYKIYLYTPGLGVEEIVPTQTNHIIYDPQINSAGQVVWRGLTNSSSNIYLYTPNAGIIQLSNKTTGTSSNTDAQINDFGQVAWVGRGSNGYNQVYLFTPGVGVKQISTDLYDNNIINPKINSIGEIVWGDSPYWHPNNPIYIYSPISGIARLTPVGKFDCSPQINSNGQVVWAGTDSGSWQIYLYTP